MSALVWSKFKIAVSLTSITAIAPLSVVTPEVLSMMKRAVEPVFIGANCDLPEPLLNPEPAEVL